MKNSLAIALSLLAVTLPVTAANAATTVNVNTGTSPKGTTDPNWTVSFNGGTATQAFTPNTVNSAWAGGSTNPVVNGARWITPTSTGTATVGAGNYNYTTVFQLTNVAQMTSKLLAGNFWADNRVLSIILNGTAIYLNNAGNQFSNSGGGIAFTSAGSGATFLEGANTVNVLVRNDSGNSGNPSGLRVAAVFTAVPEPGTWMLMMLGIGAIGFSMRRRQKTQVRFNMA